MEENFQRMAEWREMYQREEKRGGWIKLVVVGI
jgi:hypothetical protein